MLSRISVGPSLQDFVPPVMRSRERNEAVLRHLHTVMAGPGWQAAGSSRLVGSAARAGQNGRVSCSDSHPVESVSALKTTSVTATHFQPMSVIGHLFIVLLPWDTRGLDYCPLILGGGGKNEHYKPTKGNTQKGTCTALPENRSYIPFLHPRGKNLTAITLVSDAKCQRAHFLALE